MNAGFQFKGLDVRPDSHRGINANALLSVIEWLSGDECHSGDEAALIAGLGRRLKGLGLPIDRLTLHLMTLHPEYVGRTLAWAPGEPVQIHDREHGALRIFADTPFRKVMEQRETVTTRSGEGGHWEDIDVFSGRSLAQLMIVPLCNSDGPVSAASFGTRQNEGFSVTEQHVIERILPSLRNACELRVLRQAELSLLDTYIGPLTAQRILAGSIRRGEVESMEAALLVCDMRGFTELSNRLPSTQMLRLLNEYFDHVVPAITQRGGEVLKYMGDAVLAFFPGFDQADACCSALSAATAIISDLESLEIEKIKVKAGIALHFGEVSYGNIGSGRRMDFTLIGPDVNLVTRIQGACSLLNTPLLISTEFRDKAGLKTVGSAWFHQFRGFDHKTELFSLSNLGRHPDIGDA